MSGDNKELIRRMVEEVDNKGNFDVFDELIGEQIASYDPADPAPIHGKREYRAALEAYRNAFPDLHVRIDDQIAEGDKVVTRFTATGRHDGELFGIPPSGKEVEFSGIDIDRIENGRIVEEWIVWDALGLMRQLGVVPETHQ